jgi:serine protease Do
MRAGSRLARRALGVGLVLLAAWSAAAAERWGWFGIRIRDLSETEMEELAVKVGFTEGYGVVVSEILNDAPAATSGLRAGDLIVAIDGRPVVETRGLQRIVGGAPPGRELRVLVLREGRRRELAVPVGEMPPDAVAERIAAEFGFLVRDTEREAQPGEAPPPVVVAVGERTSAEQAGLRVGDRIVALNGRAVATVEGFRQAMRPLLLRDPLRLTVERRGESLRLELPPARRALPGN